MKVKYSALVSDMSGKLNGSVASKNRSGSYFRNKVTPSNPRTAAQTEARARLTDVSKEWKTLTQEQRNAWNNAVSDYKKTNIFGDIVNPSGFNLYQRLNNNLLLIGEALLTLPPLADNVGYAEIASVAVDNSSQSVIITLGAAVPAGSVAVVKATESISPGITNVSSQLRIITTEAAASGPALTVSAAYLAKFGTVGAVGRKVFVEVYLISTETGLASARTKAETLIVA